MYFTVVGTVQHQLGNGLCEHQEKYASCPSNRKTAERKPSKASFSSPKKCEKAAHAGVRIQTEPRNGFLRGAILFERVVASSGEEYLDEST